MQQDLLPLFPLRVVVFPRTPLPLHIFEERYKEMVGEAIRDKTEFGIVLAREKGIVNTGCTVTVERVLKRYPDGRMDILVAGKRRFEVLSLNQEKDYLRGAVQFFEDVETEPAPAEVRDRAMRAFQEALELAGEDAVEPELDDPQLSFQLAQVVEDLDVRLLLLRLRSEPDRMQRLADHLDRDLPKRRMAAQVRKVAPMNGHAKYPIDPKEVQ